MNFLSPPRWQPVEVMTTCDLILGSRRVLSLSMKRLVIISLLLALISACELFTPRDPEPPLDTLDPYAWIPPTSPEIVLQDLANAFPAHKENYHLDVLAGRSGDVATFRFFPDHSVASAQPGVFDGWGYAEEENFMIKLFEILNPEGIQDLSWSKDQVSTIEDRHEIIADYDLRLSYLENSSKYPSHFSGQIILSLVQNDDLLYQITTWQDVKSDSLPCWSELKTLIQ